MPTVGLHISAQVNAMPVTKSVTIQDPEKISKSELSWVIKEYPRGSDIHIEHWIFSYGQWKTLMAEDSGIQVGINQDRIFLKTFGMRCTGLGHELRLYEGVQSWGARSARDGGPTLSDLLAQRRRGVQFIALWVKVSRQYLFASVRAEIATREQDMKGPTILQSPRTVENGRVVSKWVDPPELRTKMGAVIWMEAESKWQPYEGNSGARVPMPLKTPVILLRRPDVVGLMGLGEVLDYLENERAIQNAVGGDDEDEVVSIPVSCGRAVEGAMANYLRHRLSPKGHTCRYTTSTGKPPIRMRSPTGAPRVKALREEQEWRTRASKGPNPDRLQYR